MGRNSRFSNKTMISVTADKLPNMHSTEFQGIPVVIQWPKGSVRVGERENGEPYKTEMKADYGYIPDTTAAGDGERLDIYIGPDKDAEYAYVVEQVRKSDGEFNEYKLMLGFDSLEAAEEMYNYHAGEKGDMELGDISEVPFDYLFDKVMEERQETKVEELGDDRAEIEHDEAKIAEQSDKLSLIDAFVKLYKHEFEYFTKVAEEVNDQLADALQEAGIKAAVTFRAKKPRKLKAKLLKRNQTHQYQSFQDIYNDVVDMAGVRVALYLPADRTAVGQIIEQCFTQMREAKNFPEDRGPGDGIGYVATHYLVRLKTETLHKDEYQYADTNVEIQVASVLMHAWAEITHDLLYKPSKGTLTPEERAMIDDLNRIVQEGEATLDKLQESVQDRTQQDLRFELMSSLAKRLAAQSKGLATKRIIASDVKAAAKRVLYIEQPSPHANYLKAKLALWKAHGKPL